METLKTNPIRTKNSDYFQENTFHFIYFFSQIYSNHLSTSISGASVYTFYYQNSFRPNKNPVGKQSI
ncbi:MAG: hypothetical protein U5M51_05375 [Emticicia sp.]|nr:hypothetical protein [Emticicia sp.]